jgi:hypothetical protein
VRNVIKMFEASILMISKECEEDINWTKPVSRDQEEYNGRKINASSLTVRSRHVGGRGRPQDDSREREHKPFLYYKVKVKQSRYTPWRRLGGEEV